VARVADQRVRAQRLQPGGEARRHALAVGQHAAVLVQAQHFQRHRGADRVRRIGGAVADRRAGGRGVGDGRVDLFREHGRAHRHVARGQALGQRHQVGLHAFGIAGEHRPSAAEAGDDLVDDEQDAELARRIAHRHQPAGRRHDDAARALDRLAEERRHLVGP
jgi:hypothetical protein